MSEDKFFDCPLYLCEDDVVEKDIISIKTIPVKKNIVIDITNDSSSDDECETYISDIGISFSQEDFDETPAKSEPKILSLSKKDLYESANNGPREWRRIFNREDGECCIYFVTPGEKEGPIKIGFSTRKASARIKEYKAGNAYKLRVYCTVAVKDPKAWEGVMHQIFHERRMLQESRSNEWFDITKTDVDRFFSYDEIKYAFINDDKYKINYSMYL